MDNSTAISHTVFDSFEIDESYMPVAQNEEERFKELRAVLIRRIEELIAKDLEKLMWILYRIDVSEKKVREALEINSSMNYAEALADLIIERQIEKIKTRQQFSSGEADWSFDV
jgi:hypothetical protein